MNQTSTRSVSGVPFWVYLYKTYCAKPLLRKHYKEGASVVTHFWVPTKNKNKKPKEVRKITGGRSAQKMVGKLVKEVKNTKI
jgi:hypothetical protein